MTSPDETPSSVHPEPTAINHSGQWLLHTTVVEQAIRFPTDLSLLNEAREFSEQIIDTLCQNLKIDPKPLTYRQKARAAYRMIAKQAPRCKSPVSWPETSTAILATQPRAHRTSVGAPQNTPLPLPGWLANG